MKADSLKVRCVAPVLRLADPAYNAAVMRGHMHTAFAEGVRLLLFPELSSTGATIEDLFYQSALINAAEHELRALAAETAACPDMVVIVGAPLRQNNLIFNCSCVLQNEQVITTVPIRTDADFPSLVSPSRFDRPEAAPTPCKVSIAGHEYNLHIMGGNGFLAARAHARSSAVGEDTAVGPASDLLIIPTALPAYAPPLPDNTYLDALLRLNSACDCPILFAAASWWESTTDRVASGLTAIIADGKCRALDQGLVDPDNPLPPPGEPAVRDPNDEAAYTSAATTVLSFPEEQPTEKAKTAEKITATVGIGKAVGTTSFALSAPDACALSNPLPFLPPLTDQSTYATNELNYARRVLRLQALGLARRLLHTGISRAVIGISGGLDSTLALLAVRAAFRAARLPSANIHCVAMPGFGSSARTAGNAVRLVAALGLSLDTIDIRPACLQHFHDIGQDPDTHDTTYENVQARERTQILMDLANRLGGLVIGTGDLSELALGWCTYNGDHMSMYGVNSSVSKTLGRMMLRAFSRALAEGTAAAPDFAPCNAAELSAVLRDIVATPISPELLPLDEAGEIKQSTEAVLGPYELTDFFLYNFLTSGSTREQMLAAAIRLFASPPANSDNGRDPRLAHLRLSPEQIEHYLNGFYRRVINNQFKRSCLPDGAAITPLNLSPRRGWRIPSDAAPNAWLS